MNFLTQDHWVWPAALIFFALLVQGFYRALSQGPQAEGAWKEMTEKFARHRRFSWVMLAAGVLWFWL